MELTLSLAADGVDEEGLHRLTEDLRSALNSETDVRAASPPSKPVPGERGDAVSLGTLLLTFISSGTAVALFGVLKAFFERNHSLEIQLDRPDGRRLLLRATNLDPAHVSESLAEAKAFFGEKR